MTMIVYGEAMNFDQKWDSDVYAHGRHVNKYPFDQVVSTIFQYFGRCDRQQIKVLELGCGTANNIAFLAKEGFDAYGVDGSEHAISVGRRFLQSEGLEAKLECFDFSDLSKFTDAHFDMIIDRGSITHNPRAGSTKTLDEVYRVLKNNGLFLSVMFSDAHSGVKFGSRQTDGSFIGFSDGYLKGYDFVFYFASVEDTEEFFDARFEVISKVHQVHDDFCKKDDVRAMWSVLCRKSV